MRLVSALCALTELNQPSRHGYDEFGTYRVLSDSFLIPHGARYRIKVFITFFALFSHSTEVSTQKLTKKDESCLCFVCFTEVMNGVVDSSGGSTPTYVHSWGDDRSFFSSFL